MSSSSPIQSPPGSPGPEQNRARSTPARERAGQTRLALFLKSILRPVLKGLYYVLQATRGHRRLTLGMIALLLLSIVLTTYFTTGQLPYGIGSDPFDFHVRGGSGGGDHVKNWLYALRDGDTTKLSLIQSELVMSQPPDPNQLVAQFSQPKAHLTWKAINVMGVYSQNDSSVESFVGVDVTGPGPGGNVDGTIIWHFTTLPQAQGRLLFVDLVTFRPALK